MNQGQKPLDNKGKLTLDKSKVHSIVELKGIGTAQMKIKSTKSEATSCSGPRDVSESNIERQESCCGPSTSSIKNSNQETSCCGPVVVAEKTTDQMRSCCEPKGLSEKNIGQEPSCCGPNKGSEKNINQEVSCCGPKVIKSMDQRRFIETMVLDYLTIGDKRIPKVQAQLTASDLLGSFLARVGFNRDDYEIKPGLYALGSPSPESHVLVTANYKMSFDALRKELEGENLWILVLDTFGINVWCAAGKGTFSTEEAIRQIKSTGLGDVVSHRTLILPQLGAPGVSGFQVTKATGFKVVFGPVRASDVKEFMGSNMVATPEMRRVHFTFIDRLVLTPLEFYIMLVPLSLVLLGLAFLEWANLLPYGVLLFLGAAFTGSVLVPVLLPLIPGKAFSLKGLFAGIAYTLMAFVLFPAISLWTMIAYGLLFMSIISFAALNFTGASTYTSFSGVKAEMEVAIPLMLWGTGIGVLILIVQIITTLL